MLRRQSSKLLVIAGGRDTSAPFGWSKKTNQEFAKALEHDIFPPSASVSRSQEQDSRGVPGKKSISSGGGSQAPQDSHRYDRVAEAAKENEKKKQMMEGFMGDQRRRYQAMDDQLAGKSTKPRGGNSTSKAGGGGGAGFSPYKYDMNRANSKNTNNASSTDGSSKATAANKAWADAFASSSSSSSGGRNPFDGEGEHSGGQQQQQKKKNPEVGRLRSEGEGSIDYEQIARTSVHDLRLKIEEHHEARLLGERTGVIGKAAGGADPLAEYHARLQLVVKLGQSKSRDDWSMALEEGHMLNDTLVTMLEKGPLPRAKGFKMSLCKQLSELCTRMGKKEEALQWTFKLESDQVGLEDLMDMENQERRYFGLEENLSPSEKFDRRARNSSKHSLDQFAAAQLRMSPADGYINPMMGALHSKEAYIGPRYTDGW